MTSDFFQLCSGLFKRAEGDSRARGKRVRRSPSTSSKARRLTTETLEERRLLSASSEFVDALAFSAATTDDAPLTASDYNTIEIQASELTVAKLKEAIARAAETPEDDAIVVVGGDAAIKFESASDEIVVDIDSATQGRLAICAADGELTIDANDKARALTIENGDVGISDARIENGFASEGGAIRVAAGGTLRLDGVYLFSNEATGNGGAIWSAGTVLVQNSVVANNISGGDGAAIYEKTAVAPVPTGPTFESEIADVAAEPGQTISIDLTDYFSDGDWNYALTGAADSDIFAVAPSISNGVLTATLIAKADYSYDLDLSSVAFTVVAASKADPSATATSNAFTLGLTDEYRSTGTIQAVFTELEYDDVISEYKIKEGKKVVAYGADDVPESEILTTGEGTLTLWFKDSLENWGIEPNGVGGLTYTLTFENVDTSEFETGVISSDFKVDLYSVTKVDDNTFTYSVNYTNLSYSDCGAILADAIPVTAIDPTKPMVVKVARSSAPQDKPVVRRVDGTTYSIDGQTSFAGCSSDSAEPIYAATAASSSAVVETVSNAETETTPSVVVSQSLFYSNEAAGTGVVYVDFVDASSYLYVWNCDVVKNSLGSGAASLVSAGSGAAYAANSIILGNSAGTSTSAKPVSKVSGLANLTEYKWSKNTKYDSTKALFVDAANDDYRLTGDSQAVDLGNDKYARDVDGAALDSDLLWGERFVGAAVDIGVFELQFPESPTSVEIDGYDASSQTAILSWNAVETATGYKVEQKVGGEWTVLAASQASTSFVCSGLTEAGATYVYRVSALNAVGASEAVEASTTVPKAEVPAAPTGVKIDDYDASSKTAILSWNAVETATGYKVEQKVGGEWTVLAASQTSTSFVCSGLTEVGATYVYRVSALNAVGASEAVEASITVPTSDVPAAPSDLVFDYYDAENYRLSMRWKDNSTNETAFDVEYSQDGGKTWKKAATMGANVTSRVATLVYPKGEYLFRVAARNAAGSSEPVVSSFSFARDVVENVEFSAKLPAVGEPITATVDAKAEASFQWYRIADPELSEEESAILIDGATDATYTPIADDLGYYIGVKVRSANAAYQPVLYTTHLTAVVGTSKYAPAAPSNVRFSDYDPETLQTTMNWTIESDNETGFEIEYKKDGGEWLPAATLGANVDSRVCSTVRPESAYSYRVRAVNGDLASDWAEASFSYKRDVVQGVSLSTDAPKVGEAIVATLASAANDVEFDWLRVSDSGETFELIDGATGSSYVPTVADVGCQIAVVATSKNVAYCSSASAQTAGAVPETADSRPAAPSDVAFADYDADAQTLEMSWTNNSAKATKIVVEYKIGDGDWKVAANLKADATSRVCNTVRANYEYSFRVKAVAADGAESIYASAEFSAKRDVVSAPTVDLEVPVVGEAITASVPEANEATFQWYRVSNGKATAIEGATDATYVPTTADVGKALKVVATSANPAFVSTAEATTELVVAVASVPAAPSGVAFSDYDAAARRVTMTWNDNSNNETGFKIQYSVDGGKTWRDSETLPANSTSRRAWGLTVGTTYSFRVAAFNSAGQSAWATGRFTATSSALFGDELWDDLGDELSYLD